MPPVKAPRCGFFHVIVFNECLSLENLRDYNLTMRTVNKDLCCPESKWTKKRKEENRKLRELSTYTGRDAEKRRLYLETFSKAKWSEKTNASKARHRQTFCQECRMIPEYNYLNDNNVSNDELIRARLASSRSRSEKNIREARDFILDGYKAQFHRTFGVDIKNVGQEEAKQQGAIEALRQMTGKTATKALPSILSSNTSFRQYDKLRKDIELEDHSGIEVEVNRSNYRYKVTNYEYNRAQVEDRLRRGEENVNWQELALQAGLRNKISNTFVTHSNRGKILKLCVTQCGLVAAEEWKPRKRRSHESVDVGGKRIKYNILPQGLAIQKELKQKIISGDIDIGTPIVPITFRFRKYVDGKIEEGIATLNGRKYDMEKIRMDALMEQKKFLRKPYALESSIEDIKVQLTERGVPFPRDVESVADLNDRMRIRHMATWHDHSTVAGHCHLLMMVRYLYDSLTYLTDEEANLPCGTIQTSVERPHIYILARSSSSIRDQMLYSAVRLEDIESLDQSISVDGLEYKDIMRLCLGDGPCRAMESGTQVNGHWPCSCGCGARKFRKIYPMLQRPPYTSNKQRLDIIHATDRWRNREAGTLNVFDQMDVKTLRKELSDRNVDTEGLRRPDMTVEFQKILKGIRRPPALMIDNESAALNKYEIMTCEPLHDIKTLAGNIIKEIVHVCPKDLKNDLCHRLEAIKGSKTEASGSDSRLHMVKLCRELLDMYSTTKLDIINQIYQLCRHFVDITYLAYSNESKRTPASILAMHNLTLRFAVLYAELFKNPRDVKERALFGMAYHSIVAHFPEWFRLSSLRSLNAEELERGFYDVKSITNRATNRHPENILEQNIIRAQFKRKYNNTAGKSVLKGDSQVSKLYKDLPPRQPSKFDAHFREKHRVIFAAHIRRISDYMIQDVWHQEQDGCMTFYDSPSCEQQRKEGPHLLSLRDYDMNDIHDMWDSSMAEYKRRIRQHIDEQSQTDDEEDDDDFPEEPENDELISLHMEGGLNSNLCEIFRVALHGMREGQRRPGVAQRP